MDHLISQYIDDELTLDDKIDFVRTVHRDNAFTEETVQLLVQEKLLRQTMESKASAALSTSAIPHRRATPLFSGWLGWTGWAAASLLLLLLFRSSVEGPAVFDSSAITMHPATRQHRFVIYTPGSQSVEVCGSFTGWRRIPLRPAVTDGYWEVTLELEAGEHRFTYILNGSELFPDPTVPSRETDDFGASNSILWVEA